MKVKNGQALLGAITALGTQPGTEWLKGLNARSDVQWNIVKDAFDGWNYKSQSLNPAVAAVIAIAAAAVTAGASLTATVAASVTSTVGGGVVTTCAVTAGMSSLAAQAAVALVENQGNMSKTLAALGSSSSVKSLATSMAIGGALAGFDKVMNVGVPPAQAKLPALVRNEGWGKIVQRVAGQSVISSSLNTTINGGSFRDNLVNAMLANIGNQINAEGAGLIGDNGEVLGLPGRALSHAVVSGISAEIGRGNGKGAAAGALAAELAGVLINDNLVESQGWQERQAQISRVSGALAGVIVTGKASGANSGAAAGEFVERFNRQLHQKELEAIKEQAKGNKELEERLIASSCRKVSCTMQESLNSEERKQYEALMSKYPLTPFEDGLLDNFWIQQERQRFGNYPIFAGTELEQLFTYNEGDKNADSQLFARNQWVENFADMFGVSKVAAESAGVGLAMFSLYAGKGQYKTGKQYLDNMVYPTASWKSFSISEKDIQYTATFKNRIRELRAGLSSDPKREGNVAIADIKIDGMPREMAAHSGIHTPGKGLVGVGSQNFKAVVVPDNAGRDLFRITDSEYKILDHIADKLGGNVSVKGSITIFTELKACGSCLGVVQQFQQKYPGIKVDVLDNNNVRLKP